MTLPTTSLILLILFFNPFISVSGAEERAPHGLANQNPVFISPSAYNFFHPDAAHQPSAATSNDHVCASSKCSRFPLNSEAAQVRESQVHKPTLPASPTSKSIGGGGIAGIVLAIAFALLLAMAASYVVVTRRRSGSHKAKSPDV